jgi:hypothetical protein
LIIDHVLSSCIIPRFFFLMLRASRLRFAFKAARYRLRFVFKAARYRA